MHFIKKRTLGVPKWTIGQRVAAYDVLLFDCWSFSLARYLQALLKLQHTKNTDILYQTLFQSSTLFHGYLAVPHSLLYFSTVILSFLIIITTTTILYTLQSVQSSRRAQMVLYMLDCKKWARTSVRQYNLNNGLWIDSSSPLSTFLSYKHIPFYREKILLAFKKLKLRLLTLDYTTTPSSIIYYCAASVHIFLAGWRSFPLSSCIVFSIIIILLEEKPFFFAQPSTSVMIIIIHLPI